MWKRRSFRELRSKVTYIPLRVSCSQRPTFQSLIKFLVTYQKACMGMLFYVTTPPIFRQSGLLTFRQPVILVKVTNFKTHCLSSPKNLAISKRLSIRNAMSCIILFSKSQRQPSKINFVFSQIPEISVYWLRGLQLLFLPNLRYPNFYARATERHFQNYRKLPTGSIT